MTGMHSGNQINKLGRVCIQSDSFKSYEWTMIGCIGLGYDLCQIRSSHVDYDWMHRVGV